jgi:dTDP-4-amino-4,6-dideoxy-D-galactose acyltransferase
MLKVQILDFDTRVFSFGVAQIIPNVLSEDELHNILQDLRAQNIKLVYWATNSLNVMAQQAAKICHGLLVDRKVTYMINLHEQIVLPRISDNIATYDKTVPEKSLEQLALQVGMQSRFAKDINITDLQRGKIYKLWIANSVNGEIAKQVLVYRQQQQIIGMITLGEKNNRGDIGLLAISPSHRGQNIAMQLVQAAQAQFIKDGYQFSQVVTQLDNIPACRLYEKCGYRQEKIENFYHFWLI